MTRASRTATGTGREPTQGPAVNLVREGDWLILSAALPGLKPSDFRVALVGNRQVQIDGTATYRHPVPQESLHVAERTYGPFSRAISLPVPVDTSRTAVSLERGVLTVRLPVQVQTLPLQWQKWGSGHG